MLTPMADWVSLGSALGATTGGAALAAAIYAIGAKLDADARQEAKTDIANFIERERICSS